MLDDKPTDQNKNETQPGNHPPLPHKLMTRKQVDKKRKPPKNCVDLILSIYTDDYPEETSVKAVELNSMNWIWWEEFENPNEYYSFEQCVDPSGCYEVFIMDTDGDGIEGDGFDLTYDNNLVAWGEPFTYYTVYDVGDGCASRPPCQMLELELTTDKYPLESSVYLYDVSTDTMDWWDTNIRKKNKKYIFSKCIDPLRCYELGISDSEGDGFEGNGGYQVTYDGMWWDSSEDAAFTDRVLYYFGECD
jgi:hypothetical protein